MNEKNQTIQQIKINSDQLAQLIILIENRTLSGKIAKVVFNEMMETGQSAELIIESKGYKKVTDLSELDKIIQNVIDINPLQVAEYKSGKEKLFSFFIGNIMKITQGQADPDVASEILKRKLNQS